MELVIIAAVAENRVIGKDGKLPWSRIPEDMKRFRKLTLHRPVIMGRKTCESIIRDYGKPLDKRLNIVLSRSGFSHDGVVVWDNLDDALHFVRFTRMDEAYIIGGQEIYKLAMSKAKRLEITEIRGNFDGDAYFPEVDLKEWQETNREDKAGYAFVSYKRKNRFEEESL